MNRYALPIPEAYFSFGRAWYTATHYVIFRLENESIARKPATSYSSLILQRALIHKEGALVGHPLIACSWQQACLHDTMQHWVYPGQARVQS